MEGGSFNPDIFTDASLLFDWIFDVIQQFYNLIVSNWVLNVCLTLALLGLAISFLRLLIRPVIKSNKDNNSK